MMNEERKDIFVHPSAIVESNSIGEGTRIWAFSHVLRGAYIGKNCNICDHCYIESRAFIGDGVVVKNNNMIFDMVTIGNGCFIGPHVFFTNDRYPRSRLLMDIPRHRDESWLEPVLVGRGVTIGAAAVIIPGVEIGDYAMIAAGALVTKDVTPFALMVGSPSRRMGWVCRCGLPLEGNGVFNCSVCNIYYEEKNETLYEK